jgi:hypothetical protein
MCNCLEKASESGTPVLESKKECVRKADALVTGVLSKKSYAGRLMKCLTAIGDAELGKIFLCQFISTNTAKTPDELIGQQLQGLLTNLVVIQKIQFSSLS